MLTRTVDYYRKEKEETIVSACELFGVNRQVYYRSRRSIARGQITAAEVVDLVIGVRQQMPRLGTRKLYHILKQPMRELGVGRDKLFAILKANHLDIKPRRSYRITTDSHHRFRKHKNLIVDTLPSRPEQVWVSDITYIGNRGNHRYLALVTDAYSKKIVGYDLASSLRADGALRALEMAVKKRKYKTEELIHHSDRGLQYCCDQYQQLLKMLEEKTNSSKALYVDIENILDRLHTLDIDFQNLIPKIPKRYKPTDTQLDRLDKYETKLIELELLQLSGQILNVEF